MIDLAPPLLATGGARTGIAPVNLLDVCDINGNLYYWADRKILAPNAITAAPPLPDYGGTLSTWTPPASVLTQYQPWLLGVPQISFHRSLVTDTGAFVLQNLSGDTLSRDFERIARSSALEGAFFIYRCWQPDAAAAWIEVHGTLSIDGADTETGKLKGSQLLNPSQDDTPLEIYSETCQLQWGGVRCGAQGSTECSYSYQSCQMLSRIMCVMNNYETNFGETGANIALNVTNRRRTI